MIRRFALLALAAASLLPARADDFVAKLVGSRAATQALRTMLNPTHERQRLDGVAYVAGYEVLGEPVAIPPEAAARLAALLKNADAFQPLPADEQTDDPGTAYRPGVAYRFGSGGDCVDLLVCFSCDKVAVVAAGTTWIAGIRDITQPARDVLLGVAKAILPGDEAIQALPAIRSKKPVAPPPAPVPEDAPKSGGAAAASSSVR